MSRKARAIVEATKTEEEREERRKQWLEAKRRLLRLYLYDNSYFESQFATERITGPRSFPRIKLVNDWKTQADELVGLLLNPDVASDGDAVLGISKISQLARPHGALAKKAVYMIERVAQERKSKGVLNAATDALIGIMQARGYPRPSGACPECPLDDYFIPAQKAMEVLSQLYHKNIADDKLTEKIVNAVTETAIRDTSLEIFYAARGFIEAKFGDPAGLSIDCARFKIGRPRPSHFNPAWCE